MDIEDGNKSIHEFMGWKWFDKRYPRNHGIGAPEAFEGTNDIIIQKAKYHTSWDWLMPVCHKFDNLKISLRANRKLSTYEDYCDRIDNAVTLYEIQLVWNELTEAIKWYNTQLKHTI